MDTSTFLQTHRVFNLDQAVRALSPVGGRKATLERLKYAAGRGRLKRLLRGVYASVPAGLEPEKFQPDHFLVAAALRPDAIFSHHSALELLGAAHSEWQRCTAYSARRSQVFNLDGLALRFLSHPQRLARQDALELGTRVVRRLDCERRVTGPERALLEAYEGYAEMRGPDDKHASEVADVLSHLYVEWHAVEPAEGHGEQAAHWRRKISVSTDLAPQ